jgi:hypothetical protein
LRQREPYRPHGCEHDRLLALHRSSFRGGSSFDGSGQMNPIGRGSTAQGVAST